eukprot:7019238-Heterocapsa_arctica.AAC.1
MLVPIVDAPCQVKARSGLNVGHRPVVSEVRTIGTPYLINKPSGRRGASEEAVDASLVLTSATKVIPRGRALENAGITELASELCLGRRSEVTFFAAVPNS